MNEAVQHAKALETHARYAKTKLERVFNTKVRALCSAHNASETIGFEGVLTHLCRNEKHSDAGTMYPMCEVNQCPYIKGLKKAE